jgi:hypothetical protein
MDQVPASPCGLNCGRCEYFGDTCQGCRASKGKPFWSSTLKPPVCPIFSCCEMQMKLAHCGLCKHMPCSNFVHLQEHKLGDDEFQISSQPEGDIP